MREVLVPYLGDREWQAALVACVILGGREACKDIGEWAWERFDEEMRTIARKALGTYIYRDFAMSDAWLAGSLCLSAFLGPSKGADADVWVSSESKAFIHITHDDWTDWYRRFPGHQRYGVPRPEEVDQCYTCSIPGIWKVWQFKRAGANTHLGASDVDLIELDDVPPRRIRNWIREHFDVALVGALAWRPGIKPPDDWEDVLMNVVHARSDYHIASGEYRRDAQRVIERFAKYTKRGLTLRIDEESARYLQYEVSFLDYITPSDWKQRAENATIAEGFRVYRQSGIQSYFAYRTPMGDSQSWCKKSKDAANYALSCPKNCVIAKYCDGVAHAHLWCGNLPCHVLIGSPYAYSR